MFASQDIFGPFLQNMYPCCGTISSPSSSLLFNSSLNSILGSILDGSFHGEIFAFLILRQVEEGFTKTTLGKYISHFPTVRASVSNMYLKEVQSWKY